MTTVRNPTNKDFTVTYDVGGNGAVPFTVPSFDISTFDDEHIGHHVAHHLAKHIVLNVEGIKTNFDDDYKRVYKEITEL